MGDVPPEQVIVMASGTTADLYHLPGGRIEAGLDGDVVLMDAPVSTAAEDALQTLSIGDTPGISGVIVVLGNSAVGEPVW